MNKTRYYWPSIRESNTEEEIKTEFKKFVYENYGIVIKDEIEYKAFAYLFIQTRKEVK